MARDKLTELLSLVRTLCDRLGALVSELLKTPNLPDEQAKIVLMWRILLLSLSTDIGLSIVRLGQLRDEEHSRAMRMLDRSLFEYGLRLEYYFFCPADAVKHGNNLQTWWGVLLKASQSYMDIDSLTKEERRRLNDVIKSMGDLEIPAIRHMLRHCLTMNGFKGGERRRKMKWLLGNYYHFGSALVHGSQGAFLDFFTTNPTGGKFEFTSKSARYSIEDTLFNSAIHLIGTLVSEEKHRKAYLGSDMYYRDLELASRVYGFLEGTRPRGNLIAH